MSQSSGGYVSEDSFRSFSHELDRIHEDSSDSTFVRDESDDDSDSSAQQKDESDSESDDYRTPHGFDGRFKIDEYETELCCYKKYLQ